MALELVNTTTSDTGNSGTTTLTTSVPAGTASGDLLVWHMSGAIATLPTAPSGWSTLQATSGTAQNISVWYRWATGSEPTSYTAALPSSRWAAGMMAWRGALTTDPFGDTIASAAGTTAYNPGTITTTGPDRVVLAFAHATLANASGTVITSTNMTRRYIDNSTAPSGNNATAAGFSTLRATAGTFTPALSASPAPSRSFSIVTALRPAPETAGGSKIWVDNGTTWVAGTLWRDTGTAWVQQVIHLDNGTAWAPVGS